MGYYAQACHQVLASASVFAHSNRPIITQHDSSSRSVRLEQEQERYSAFWLGPEDAQIACLLIHGFSGNPIEMQSLGEALAAQQIRVYGMLVAGHNGDSEEFITTGRKQWLASAEDALAQLTPYRYVFVCGLSMGGALSLMLASRHSERIAGVIALSTLTRVQATGWYKLALLTLPLVRRTMKWFYPLARLNFNDPKVQAEVLKQARIRDPTISTIDFTDPQTIAFIKQQVRIPLAAIDELVHLTRQERAILKKVTSPLLIIHSKRDQTVPPECAEELYRLAVKAKPKIIHWLEQSDHVITIGPEREEVYQLVVAFMHTTIRDAEKTALPLDVQRAIEGESLPDR